MLDDSLYLISFIKDNLVCETLLKVPFNILVQKINEEPNYTIEYEPDKKLKEICNNLLKKKYKNITILSIKRII